MEKQAQAVSFQGSLGVFFRNYLVFGGRSSRSEFWYIALWSVLISLVTSIGTAAFEDFGASYPFCPSSSGWRPCCQALLSSFGDSGMLGTHRG